MKTIHIILIITIAVIALYILIKKYNMLKTTKIYLCNLICQKTLNEQKVKTEHMSGTSYQKYTGAKIDENASILSSIGSFFKIEKKEQFEANPNENKTLLLETNVDNIGSPKYFTLEQVDENENFLTKYIREVALGAKYACPKEEISNVPKKVYVDKWLSMNEKINKDSQNYDNTVERLNKLYVENNNELSVFKGNTIQGVYDDLTRTNKAEFEKAFVDGEMATYKSDRWYDNYIN